jgi:hypothetical protein
MVAIGKKETVSLDKVTFYTLWLSIIRREEFLGRVGNYRNLLPTAVREGAESLKGSRTMGDKRIFIKI